MLKEIKSSLKIHWLTASRLRAGTWRQQGPGAEGTQRQRHHSAQAGAPQRHQAGRQAHSRPGREGRAVEQEVPGGGAERGGAAAVTIRTAPRSKAPGMNSHGF